MSLNNNIEKTNNDFEMRASKFSFTKLKKNRYGMRMMPDSCRPLTCNESKELSEIRAKRHTRVKRHNKRKTEEPQSVDKAHTPGSDAPVPHFRISQEVKNKDQTPDVLRSMEKTYEYVTLGEIEKKLNYIVFRSSTFGIKTNTKLLTNSFVKPGQLRSRGTPFCFDKPINLLERFEWRKMISNNAYDNLHIITDSYVVLPTVEHRFNYIKLKKYCGYAGSIIAESINWDKLTPSESYFITESHIVNLTFDEKKWKNDRVGVMTNLLRDKFKPDNIYGKILRATKKYDILYYEMHKSQSDEVIKSDQMFTEGAIESITRMLKKDNPKAILNEKHPLLFKIGLLYKNQTFPRMRNWEKTKIEKDVPYWGVRVIRYKKIWKFYSTTRKSDSRVHYRTHDVVVGENHIGQILMNIRQEHARDWYGEGEPWLNN